MLGLGHHASPRSLHSRSSPCENEASAEVFPALRSLLLSSPQDIDTTYLHRPEIKQVGHYSSPKPTPQSTFFISVMSPCKNSMEPSGLSFLRFSMILLPAAMLLALECND